MFHLFDLHCHTPFSDGQVDLDTLLKLLIKIGIKIVGFADHIFPGSMYKHGKTLTNCHNKDTLLYRKKVLRLYDKKYPQIHILNGGEIDIFPHGTLTLPKGITPDFFDYLLVAKHHTLPKPLNLFKNYPRIETWLWTHSPRKKLSKTLWFKGLHRAFYETHPDIFAHPQEGMPWYMTLADYKRLIYLCKKYGVALELNHFDISRHKRLLFLARQYGIKFSLGSDFHGFGGNWEEKLRHSQEMYALAEEYNLELIDPWVFVKRKEENIKKEEDAL